MRKLLRIFEVSVVVSMVMQNALTISYDLKG